ncbi:MAG: NAD(P)/FAD-dependent oxidoreductase [Candidatus Odinarchaeota archaeon]
MRFEEWFDTIVLGAGTAGCMAAYTAAKSGLKKVALVDRKPKERIGKKVCGDGIKMSHIRFLVENGFQIDRDSLIAGYPEALKLVSPDKRHKIELPTGKQVAVINRHEFGQALLAGALSESVTLFDSTKFTALKSTNDGVKIKLETGNKEFSLSTSLVIDASGFNSSIRKNHLIFGDSGHVKDSEQFSCYREICEIDPPGNFKDSFILEFSFEATRGGYGWVFHRDGNEFNTGIGIPGNQVKDHSPKKSFEKYMANQFMNRKTIEGAGGIVPTRHPLPTLVKDNIILVGDAGAIVNPVHGGGLGSSLVSGHVAGNIAARQVPSEGVTERDLWPFNREIMQRYGLKYSVLDLFRILLQYISDEELNDAFSKEYLPLGKIFMADYDPLMAILRKLRGTWEQLPSRNFNRLPEYVERVDMITSKYPESPDKLDEWTKSYEGIYNKLTEIFSLF